MQNAISVTPLPGYITLKLLEPETKTASGLELPETSQEKPQMGKVIAISNIIPLTSQDILLLKAAPTLVQEWQKVDVGSIVVFKKYAGHPVKIADGEIQLVEFKDIIGVIEYGS